METTDIYSQLLATSKQIGVPIKRVLDMLWYLLINKNIKNNKLVQRVGVSKNALNQIKKTLSSYFNPPSNETSLKKGVNRIFSKLYEDNYLTEEDLLKTLIENNLYQQLIEFLYFYRNKKPVPKRNYDQFPATIETTAKRAVLLNFLGDVRSKRILFLGDDDLTSIATSYLRLAEKILVLDIDERIINSINYISTENDLKIKTIKHDLRKPLSLELQNKFDTVFTDPPYTPAGINLFISRALEAIDKKNQSARIYVCYGNSDRAKERFLPIQNIFTNSGLLLRYTFDKFNRYEGAESIGSSSSLYIGEITPKTKPLIKGNYDKPIYTTD